MSDFKRKLKKLLPAPAALTRIKGFSWLGHYLHEHPRLWALHRRGVALGVALGIGVGVFPVPLQMLMAAGMAVVCRANVTAAAAATWLTNPFTMAPIWFLAAFLGNLVLPGRDIEIPDEVHAVVFEWGVPASWWPSLIEGVTSWGPALLVGFPLAGLVLGISAYLVVYWGWAAIILFERKRRVLRRR